MPSAQPEGDPAPTGGQLPARALAELGRRPFGVYVHVPFCRVRCGYCDFNTYVPAHLPDDSASRLVAGPSGATDGAVPAVAGPAGPLDAAGPTGYVDTALSELDLAVRVLGPTAPTVDTVFVGGGTPTLLPARDLARLLHGIRARWGLAEDAEVTTEANPDTVSPAGMRELAEAGFTRVSLGMQSAVPRVLAALDRTHDPAGVAAAVAAVRDAGMQVSLDLIYGAPGETDTDWDTSLAAALELRPDHLSAYALVIEPGTRLAAQVRAGLVRPPEDDVLADRYERADAALGAAGFAWYEVSNWARADRPDTRCRHNLGYWSSDDWWGVGPGAHTHIGGVRWWNVRHPTAYAQALAGGRSPAAAREVLTAEQRYHEQVLLRVRLAQGLPIGKLRPQGAREVAALVADGLVDGRAAVLERSVRLTRRGRLLADHVVRRLLA